MDAGLLVARVAFGLLAAAHGAQKLFGWFGGYGLAGTGAFFEQLGFRPGRAFAAAAGLGELVGGGLLAFGLLGPVGPATLVSVMIVATATVHWGNGLFASTNGVELPALYAAAAATLALTGPGAFSLDEALGLASLWTPTIGAAALGAAALGSMASLAVRKTPSASAHA